MPPKKVAETEADAFIAAARKAKADAAAAKKANTKAAAAARKAKVEAAAVARKAEAEVAATAEKTNSNKAIGRTKKATMVDKETKNHTSNEQATGHGTKRKRSQKEVEEVEEVEEEVEDEPSPRKKRKTSTNETKATGSGKKRKRQENEADEDGEDEEVKDEPSPKRNKRVKETKAKPPNQVQEASHIKIKLNVTPKKQKVILHPPTPRVNVKFEGQKPPGTSELKRQLGSQAFQERYKEYHSEDISILEDDPFGLSNKEQIDPYKSYILKSSVIAQAEISPPARGKFTMNRTNEQDIEMSEEERPDDESDDETIISGKARPLKGISNTVQSNLWATKDAKGGDDSGKGTAAAAKKTTTAKAGGKADDDGKAKSGNKPKRRRGGGYFDKALAKWGDQPGPDKKVYEDGENDGNAGENEWVYNWKNPIPGIPDTLNNANAPNLKDFDVASLYRGDADDVEEEFIAKRYYDALWKLILEPRDNNAYAGYMPQKLVYEIPTEHWDHDAGRLSDEQKWILSLHDDFADRTTVLINVVKYKRLVKRYKAEKKAAEPPKDKHSSTIGRGFPKGNSNPIIDAKDYAPNPARLVLPLTRFSDNHPLLLTDNSFDAGRDFDDGNIVTSLPLAKNFLQEDEKNKGHTIGGANGRQATITWQSGDWQLVNKKGTNVVLRGSGVPWGQLAYVKGRDVHEFGHSCALDAMIILGRWLGVFYREGDKPTGLTWDQYLQELTGPQLLFRDAVARDWDTTFEMEGLRVKATLWTGCLTENGIAGLSESERDPFWTRFELSDRAFETRSNSFTGKSIPSEVDFTNAEVIATRVQNFKDKWDNNVKDKVPDFGYNLAIIDVWNYIFGEIEGPEIMKPCANFNFRYVPRLRCRRCNHQFQSSAQTWLPLDEYAVAKETYREDENTEYEVLASSVRLGNMMLQGRNIADMLTTEFLGSQLAHHVCPNCNPKYKTEIKKDKKGTGIPSKHANEDEAPVLYKHIIGLPPKQLVVQLIYPDVAKKSRHQKFRQIGDQFDDHITFRAISSPANDVKNSTEQDHHYRFVGCIITDAYGWGDHNKHFRTLLKESETTWRMYDGKMPLHNDRDQNLGMIIGDIQVDDKNTIFTRMDTFIYPMILIYERIEQEELKEIKKTKQPVKKPKTASKDTKAGKGAGKKGKGAAKTVMKAANITRKRASFKTQATDNLAFTDVEAPAKKTKIGTIPSANRLTGHSLRTRKAVDYRT